MQIRRLPPVQLPIWPDRVRGASNAMLRSALFAGVPSRYRRTIGTPTDGNDVHEPVEIAAQDGIVMLYAGVQLVQYDADVFFEILHRSRRQTLGETATFDGAAFLRAIGRGDSKQDYDDLNRSLRRLRTGNLDIRWRTPDNRELVYSGGLLAKFVRDTSTKLYSVSLFPEIRVLFGHSGYTLIQWDERQRLMRNPLAQWLHGYYGSHAKPYPVTVGFLQRLTGQTAARPRDFARSLRNALAFLEEKLGWKAEWVDPSRVKVTRTPSASQSRNIARNASKQMRQTGESAQITKNHPKDIIGMASSREIVGQLFPRV